MLGTSFGCRRGPNVELSHPALVDDRDRERHLLDVLLALSAVTTTDESVAVDSGGGILSAPAPEPTSSGPRAPPLVRAAWCSVRRRHDRTGSLSVLPEPPFRRLGAQVALVHSPSDAATLANCKEICPRHDFMGAFRRGGWRRVCGGTVEPSTIAGK